MNARLSIMFVAWCLAWPVAAGDVVGLYNGQAEVADRTPAELARGAAAALTEVLIKLTGNRRTPIAGRDSGLMKRASKLMLQYTYLTPAPDGPLVLAAEFDELALGAELSALDVAVWGKERPDSLIWLVVDGPERRQLIAGDDPGTLGEAVLRAAERRGIPALLPLMDIEESQHLLHAGDWAGLSTTALALSGRYGAPATLVGHLRLDDVGVWHAQWGLHISDERQTWQQQGELMELLAEDAFDVFADSLAQKYADQGMLAQAEQLSLSIYDVRSADDYARLANYLQGLDTVGGLFVTSVDNQRVEVRFSARGGRSALAQSIAFGQVLMPVPNQPDAYRLSH